MSRQTTLARALALAVAAAGLAAGPVAAQEVAFDLQQLAQNGLSADIAAFFAKEARFLPGTHLLDVSVNGGRRMQVSVRFTTEGAPCFDADLLAQLGLRPLPEQGGEPVELAAAHPGSIVALMPGSARMDVTVPQSALIDDGRSHVHARGGSALVLNYDLFSQHIGSATDRSSYTSARLEAGFNAANWAVRSRGDYTRRGQESGYTQQETFAQRPVERLSSILQVGQIAAISDGFGGLPLWGAQLVSDDAQLQMANLAVPITGVADSHAVVEVRQRGNLVHRSVVTPGPFRIDALGAVSSSGDLQVEVVEEDGRSTRFSVPAPMAAAAAAQPASHQLGVGRYRAPAGTDLDRAEPWLAYAGYAFDLWPGARLSTSALLSAGYQGAQAQGSFSLGERSWWGMGARVAAAGADVGHELQVQGNASFSHGFSAGISAQARSRGYRSLEDSMSTGEEGTATALRTVSASASWSSPAWGAFSYGVWASAGEAGPALGHSVSASRRFGRATASLTLQHSGDRGTSAFMNLQIPLGGRSGSVSARAYRYENGDQAMGASYQNRTAGQTAYQVDVSRSQRDQRLGATASRQTAYGTFNAGLSQTGSGTRVATAGASGGVVLTGDGTLALSGSRISDTFAVVKIPGVSGVRMGGAGTATTSRLGTAVVPAVTPYRSSRLQLEGRTLPLNYRFSSSTVDVSLARGSVGVYTITGKEIRQLLLTVTTPDGEPATVGSALYDAAGAFLGTVIGDGNAILDNEQIGQPLFMEHQGSRCEIQYVAPPRFSAERPYEEADAQCV